MGGSSNTTISTTEQKVGNVRIQSSAYGLTLVLAYGRNRIPGNLMWYDGFVATPHTTTTETESGGKGGSSTTTQSNTTYTYSADAVMGLVDGPTISVQSIWKGKDRTVGVSFLGAQSCTENLTIPSNKKVRLSFYTFAGSVSSLKVLQTPTAAEVTLTNPAGYTVSAGIITIVSDAYIGRVVRATYAYNPTGDCATAAGAEGLTHFQGSWGQGTWSYLSSAYPSAAIPYSGISYVAGAAYALNTDASFANHNFEVNFKLQYSGTIPDANPADIITDLLTNPDSGAQFPGSRLYDLTTFSNYCRAIGIFLSPVFIEQQEARNIITTITDMCNSAVVWSEGYLKIIPFGDTAATGNGATYTPNLTPIYDLDDNDFIVSGSEDPVVVELDTPADAFNQVQVEFNNRANGYNSEIAERKDQANIEQFGLRNSDPQKVNGVCSLSVATIVAQHRLQRGLYVRNKFKFYLGWRYVLLEPMDLVTLTDVNLGLNKYVVRIVEIGEDESGLLSVVCEDFPQGVAHATLYPDPVSAGYQTQFNAPPGNVTTPAFIEWPIESVVIDNEIGVAVSGSSVYWGGCNIWYSTDNVTYKKWGRSYGSRYGTLASGMAAGTGATATVQLLGLGGQMLSGSATDAAAGALRCYVGGEFFDYQTATLVATNKYNLTTLTRGISGTIDVQHTANETFVRVDGSVARVGPLDLKLVGQTFYFKFTSFNVYGNKEQSLASVPAYSYKITRDVSSDSILTPPEKPTVILEYSTEIADQVDLDAQATALSITTEKTAYDQSMTNLINYMATLTSPVMWNNVNGNTNLP